MESESTVNEKYFNKLTIERLNEVIEKMRKLLQERDESFERIYNEARDSNPKFDEMVDEEIRRIFKSRYKELLLPMNNSFTEAQRKSYVRDLWINYLNKNECTN